LLKGRPHRLVGDGGNAIQPWLKEQWCIPPAANADFVWHIEDVLDVSHRPPDPAQPLVCLDETSRRLLADIRPPLPEAVGHPARHDPAYVRGGVGNWVLVPAPLPGWREGQASDHRTRIAWAHGVRDLVDVHVAEAERTVLVMDHRNTHAPASRSAACPPDEATRLAERLEIHDPPKQGSGLTMAELELSVLHRQCLGQRFPDRAAMAAEVRAWTSARNLAHATIDWQVTTTDARTKRKRLYPPYKE
jgi:hypothetical protein